MKKALVTLVSFVLVFFVGFTVGKTNSLNFNQAIIENKTSNKLDFSPFWKVWDELSSKFLYRTKLNPQIMMNGAIKGMVASLGDPYTTYLDAQDYKAFQDSMASKYEGIGVEMGYKDNQVVVVSPFKDSPADKAGIKPGDYILQVGDTNTAGLTLTEVASKIRGDEGTTVKITLLHSQEKNPYTVEIKRELIVYKTVNVKYLDNGYAQITIWQFADETTSEWDDVMKELQNKDIKGVILDLRDNPGGYVDSATYIAGDFVGNQVVVKQKFADGHTKSIKSDNNKKRLAKYKSVVLVNNGTASAAEILAGAISYYDQEVMIGEKTFGKGIVQDQVLFPDKTSLHITSSEWLLPNDQNIHGKGIDPTIEVKMSEDEIKKGTDPQLNRAIEYLNSK